MFRLILIFSLIFTQGCITTWEYEKISVIPDEEITRKEYIEKSKTHIAHVWQDQKTLEQKGEWVEK